MARPVTDAPEVSPQNEPKENTFMKKTLLITLAVATLATSALAQPAPVLTQTQIADAIAAGTKAKGGRGLSLVDSQQAFGNAMMAGFAKPGTQTGSTGFSLRLYTPQTWIEQRASDAAKFYKPFGVADVTDDDLAPVLRVVVYPDKPTMLNGQGMSEARNAAHVVLRDDKKTAVVQPLSVEPFTDLASSALRDKAYVGITATFDLNQVETMREADKDKEFLVVVVGDHGERTFKIKTKHFDRLPYHLLEADAR
jgi:hypothetical protein